MTADTAPTVEVTKDDAIEVLKVRLHRMTPSLHDLRHATQRPPVHSALRIT